MKTHQPCPCGQSSDAYTDYGDHGHCFSCGKHFQGDSVPDIEEGFSFQYVPWRGVSTETMRFYDVSTKVDPEGQPIAIAAPFDNGAKQVRLIGEKRFFSQGNMSEASLFGIDKFEAGGRDITITEGWIDALSCYEIIRRPSISVRSSSSAKKDFTRQREYINSFDRIYLAFDSDGPGQEAAEAVASLFDFNKVYHVKMARKDCNEYLQNNEADKFRQAWYAAKRFLPDGIISSRDDFHRIIDDDQKRDSIPFPFESWNEKSDGIRTGEFTLVSADEGTGKTEILRAVEYHLLSTTKFNVGTVHLEEDKGRQLKGLAGYVLDCPAHLKDTPVSKEDIKNAVDLITEGDRLHLYSHFDSDDPDCILDRIRFMASACSCRFIFLDHIGLLVSGLETDDERRKLDYISTRLALMVKKLDFSLFVAAHVNKEGNIRGSTYPSKVAHTWIHLQRNLVADTEEERNRTYVTFRKSRFTGRTGPAGVLQFNPETFKITEGQELPT